jgi:hypothetical protein
MDFEWDDDKAGANARKHGVTFSEAMTVFGDPVSVTGYDPKHADDEDRFLTMGTSLAGRLLVVSRFASSAHGWRVDESERITKMATSHDEPGPSDELQPEYDFRSMRGVVRGKYASRYQERLRVVRLAPDVSAAFTDEDAVNAALREYLNGHPELQTTNPA